MSQLGLAGAVASGQGVLDQGISDVVIHDTGQGQVLYTTTGAGGGIAAYAIGPDGSLTLIDTAIFPPEWAGNALADICVIDVNGTPHLVAAGTDTGALVSFDLDADGMLGTASTMGGGMSTQAIGAVAQISANTLFIADAANGGLVGFDIDASGGATMAATVADTNAIYAESIVAIETVTLGGVDFVIGASGLDQGVTVYQTDPAGLSPTSSIGIAQGLGIMSPTDLDVVMVDGRCFVLVASAPGAGGPGSGSGAISVMELGTDGVLTPTDHILDTAGTRFGDVQTLEVVEAAGRTFVLAGGGDDGLTVFALSPGGRLQTLEVLVDTFAIGLENVTAIEAVAIGDTVHMYLGSGTSPGVTAITLNTAQIGDTAVAAAGGGTLGGTDLGDMLVGGAGDDRLTGGAGDDILEDGAGSDTLIGGDGRDVFVLRADGVADRIDDFDWTRDRIDLSGWPFLYDPTQLTITTTAVGAIIEWRGEVLEITTANGTGLLAWQVQSAMLDGPHRTPDLDIVGTGPGDELYQGTRNGDSFDGGMGDDTLYGFGGRDVLRGGDGQDYIAGGGGQDQLFGDAGDDEIDGGSGNDRLVGGDGQDTLRGELGDDWFDGGAGDDFIEGGDGRDTVYAGTGADIVRGQNGNDRIFGQHQADTLNGGFGADTINGNEREDVIFGGGDDDEVFGDGGFDILYGDAGDDLVHGGHQADNLYGGAGNDLVVGDQGIDRLFGGAGSDTLIGGTEYNMLVGDGGSDSLIGGPDVDLMFGGTGNDTVNGNDGNDRMSGGPGADIMDGGAGDDRMFGDMGSDTIRGGTGNDRIFGNEGYDLIFGGDGDDTILAGSDNDTIEGGAGNDELWGLFNEDTFVFRDGHGVDTIQDFDATHADEKLDLSGVTALVGIADVLGPTGAAQQVGGDVRIDTGGGNAIVLIGVSLSDLDASDFIF